MNDGMASDLRASSGKKPLGGKGSLEKVSFHDITNTPAKKGRAEILLTQKLSLALGSFP